MTTPDSRQKIIQEARAEFINCVSNGSFEIEHKVKVDERLAEHDTIEYNSGDLEFTLLRATLSRKKDKEAGEFTYFVKIVVE